MGEVEEIDEGSVNDDRGILAPALDAVFGNERKFGIRALCRTWLEGFERRCRLRLHGQCRAGRIG